MKPYHEALSRRKHRLVSDAQSPHVEELENKKNDLAPEVKDTHKIEVDIGVHSAPQAALSDGPQDPTLAMLMGKEPEQHEIDQINSISKPKSLFEAAQKAILAKKKA